MDPLLSLIHNPSALICRLALPHQSSALISALVFASKKILLVRPHSFLELVLVMSEDTPYQLVIAIKIPWGTKLYECFGTFRHIAPQLLN